MKCKHCGEGRPPKSGHVRGHQRYRCRACKKHFNKYTTSRQARGC